MGFFNFGSSSGSGSGQSDETNDLYAESKRNRSSSLIIFVVIIVGYFLYSMFAQSASCAGQPTSTGRVKLAEGLCRFTEFVFPEIGTSVYTGKTDKADKMELGFQEEMVNFYNASGIQPVIYDKTGEPAMTQEELQAFADDFYENGLFSNPDVNDIHDEGHFLSVFQAAEDGSLRQEQAISPELNYSTAVSTAHSRKKPALMYSRPLSKMPRARSWAMTGPIRS